MVDDDLDREMPFGPLESDDVTAEVYGRAYKELKRFVELDVSRIKTIEDLSAEASLLGEELQRVVVSSGEIQETNFDYQNSITGDEHKAVDRTWVIRKPVGDHKIVAHATKRSKITGKDVGGAVIDAYRIVGGRQLSLFNIKLPVGQDIGVTGDPILDILGVGAVDWRSGKAVSYYPAEEPNNSDVQQGFAKVLQDGLREVLAVIPAPQ